MNLRVNVIMKDQQIQIQILGVILTFVVNYLKKIKIKHIKQLILMISLILNKYKICKINNMSDNLLGIFILYGKILDEQIYLKIQKCIVYIEFLIINCIKNILIFQKSLDNIKELFHHHKYSLLPKQTKLKSINNKMEVKMKKYGLVLVVIYNLIKYFKFVILIHIVYQIYMEICY